TPIVIDTVDTSSARVLQLNDTIDELCKRRQTLADILTQAVIDIADETSTATAEEAQVKTDKITFQIDALGNVLYDLTSTEKEREKIVTKINFSDLPMFQLKSQETYWPNHMKYSSVEQFLKTLEKVIAASGNNIEEVWCRYICLTLPYDHDSWLETDLKRCKT
ncbi:hypothetical protein A0J61_10256, partial [Choanephora cucurbitarum]